MAILKIARMGHPVLCQAATVVSDPLAPEIQRLIADMIETMTDAPGIGLAAPQVHVGKRVVIFYVPAHRAQQDDDPDSDSDSDSDELMEGREEDGDGPQPLTVLINPEIEPLDDDMAFGWEGCLSLPGLTGIVPRFTRIRYRGLGRDGESIDRIAQGFHARVVQHECDHLDGILYPQRMDDLASFGFTDEIARSTPDDDGPEDGGPEDDDPGDDGPGDDVDVEGTT